MSNLRLVPVNHYDVATLTATPAASASLPVSNTQLIARDAIFRSNANTATQVISGNFGGQVRQITCWALLRHNALGGQVRLQLFSDLAGTVEIYNSGILDVYADGVGYGSFAYGVGPWGVGTALDPLALDAPFIKFITAQAALSFTITLTDPGGIARSWDVGRIWLGDYLEAPKQARFGKALGWETSSEKGRTYGGSQRPRVGEMWRVMRVDLFQLTDADRAIWLDLLPRLDITQPCLVCLYPDATGRQLRDHTMEATMTNLQENIHADYGLFTQPFSFEET